MAAYEVQKVLSVHHWNESLFTFTSTRATSLRFESGHFVMVGLMVDGRALLRAYSIASAHWEEHLEFFSIKVQDGPLTSRLQHLKVGDDVLVGKKPTGTLVITDLLPGRFLYLFATGTGLAPFMSIIRDPDTYARFDQVVIVMRRLLLLRIRCWRFLLFLQRDERHAALRAFTRSIHHHFGMHDTGVFRRRLGGRRMRPKGERNHYD